jgi:hypothetical protein
MPESTDAVDDFTLSKRTSCVRLWRNELIQLRVLSQMPKQINLLLSLWCGTVSKALPKSSSAISICFSFDVVFRISSKDKII